MVMLITTMHAVAGQLSWAGLEDVTWSVQKFSFFRLSAGATRRLRPEVPGYRYMYVVPTVQLYRYRRLTAKKSRRLCLWPLALLGVFRNLIDLNPCLD